MTLEVVHGLIDSGVARRKLFDGGHEAQADGILVRIQEAAAHRTVSAVAHEQHGRAFAFGQEEAILDDARGQLEHLFDAHRHLVALRPRRTQAALGQQGIHTLGQNYHLRGNLVVAGLDADNGTRVVLHQIFHADAGDNLAASLLAQLSQPRIEGGAQNTVAVTTCFAQLLAGEIDGHVAGGIHQGNALMGDLALEGNVVPLDVAISVLVKNLAQRVSVNAAAGHVLRPSRLTALHDEHALALLGCHVGRNGAGTAAAHDDDIEIALFHAAPPLVIVPPKGAARRQRPAFAYKLIAVL